MAAPKKRAADGSGDTDQTTADTVDDQGVLSDSESLVPPDQAPDEGTQSSAVQASDEDQARPQVTATPPPNAQPAVQGTTADDAASHGYAPAQEKARAKGPYEVVHDAVGRWARGALLHEHELAELTKERLQELLALGALVDHGQLEEERARAAEVQPQPVEDAERLAQHQENAARAPAQDYDVRPAQPEAG